ncbi:sulfatase-like hydrolase/transferase [uncultured Winogradskyella sp.]|uniref:sulfatase-like hydrolase/transferase n=1 Tax=uncultured Winogradskyella sp. TaxID=395353 RepID=UPI002604A91F|nr:sulfatase-like hydrolase/transferase [uncultured Winogradskyella sp.]
MSLRNKVIDYLKNDKLNPTLVALAAGLYPMIYVYSKNFSIVNSFEHLVFFVLSFLVLPSLVFNAINWGLKRLNKAQYSLLVIAMLNVFTFLFLIKIITYSGPQRKKTVLIVLIAVLFALYLKKHLKRLVLLQYLLAFVSVFSLVHTIYTNTSISNAWQNQPDDIIKVKFKTKPNVYVIQPDGYANFFEIYKGYYNYDNSEFEAFLNKNNFTHYPNFRSNYSTTLSSNSSFFMMKHHYYNKRISNFELYNARNMIVSKNPVLEIFKNNGYSTHFITQTGYMMFNRPKMGYDYCNLTYGDFPYISPGIAKPIDISTDLKSTISDATKQPKFVFIQLLKPWHIKSKKKNSSNDKDIERQEWLKNLEEANTILRSTIELIKKHDNNALVIIASDHGGYVGFNYASEADAMTKDRDLIYSIYSSQLSIHWPNNNIPSFNDKFKTSVNVFRLLFTYLSKNNAYLEHLEADVSYKVLRHGVSDGIYEYINEDDQVILKEFYML